MRGKRPKITVTLEKPNQFQNVFQENYNVGLCLKEGYFFTFIPMPPRACKTKNRSITVISLKLDARNIELGPPWPSG